MPCVVCYRLPPDGVGGCNTAIRHSLESLKWSSTSTHYPNVQYYMMAHFLGSSTHSPHAPRSFRGNPLSPRDPRSARIPSGATVRVDVGCTLHVQSIRDFPELSIPNNGLQCCCRAAVAMVCTLFLRLVLLDGSHICVMISFGFTDSTMPFTYLSRSPPIMESSNSLKTKTPATSLGLGTTIQFPPSLFISSSQTGCMWDLKTRRLEPTGILSRFKWLYKPQNALTESNW